MKYAKLIHRYEQYGARFCVSEKDQDGWCIGNSALAML